MIIYEKIQSHLYEVHMHWRALCETVPQIQGILIDRQGRHYWRLAEEYAPGNYDICCSAWFGLTSLTHQNAGWITVGADPGETVWTIHDVRVDDPHYQQRGIGTALVRAAIQLARRKRMERLQGRVTRGDAAMHPFLPAWYEQLGFTVERMTHGDDVAVFWMDLRASVPSSGKQIGGDRKNHLRPRW